MRTMTQRTAAPAGSEPVARALPLICAAVALGGSPGQLPDRHRLADHRREDNQFAASPTNIASLSSVVQRNPNDPQAYNMRGSVFGQSGRNQEALADFNKAISLDPELRAGLRQPRTDLPQDRQARSRACRLQQGAHARSELRGRLSRPRHRASPAQAAVRRLQRLQQGDFDPARQRRRPITTAACSIRASGSTSSRSTISRPPSGCRRTRPSPSSRAA